MRVRIVVAAILIPAMLFVILGLPPVVTVFFVAFFAAIGAYELLNNTGLVRHFRLVVYSMLFAFVIPFWSFYGSDRLLELVGILVFFALLFAENMMAEGKIPFQKLCVCFMAGMVLPYMFSAIARIMAMDHGRNLVLLPFLIAFTSDGGAYFIGVFFGKHKMAPVISPKKTWEGFIGGITFAILGTVIYVLVQQLCFGMQVNYLYAVVYGIIGSLAGVFGDLCFSMVKRQTGIKDYGNIFPGHGGMYDRFDSVIVVTPLIECLFLLIPAIY